jgi:glycosyltransferase involved in cell wall biosynthesis
VQRWLKFVKYLPEFRVEPIVYIPENPSYPIEDATLESEISNEVTILKQPIKEPYKQAKLLSKKDTQTISKGIIHKPQSQSFVEKLMLFIRGNFFIPDARKNWIKPSVEFLSDYIASNRIDTIITTGPPHSLHLIGHTLKKNLEVCWIADFRDPWTTIGYHKKLKLLPWAKRRHLKLESKVLNSADRIIVTGNKTRKEFSDKTNQPINIITNGYDVEDYIETTLDRQFSIAHIGSLLSERNPKVLWEVLQELIKEDKVFDSHFRLNLVGVVSKEILESIEAYGLSHYVSVRGYVPHYEAVKYQKQSQVLLLVEIDSEDTKCIVPGKLFEYMVSNRPILALGPTDSDVEDIIKSTNTGMYFNYNEKSALKDALKSYFKAFMKGNLQSHPIGLQKYSRKQLTKKLSEIILS